MKIEDEYGNRWVCRGGDPAMRLVNRLKRMRYEWVILPLATLATGELGREGKTPEDPLRAGRLAECIGVLSSNS